MLATKPVDVQQRGAAGSRLTGLAGGGLILLLTMAAYLPALHGAFVFDDLGHIVQNPLIQAPDGLYRFWFSTEFVDYWPLTYTTLWIEWRLWGTHTLGYHLANVLLHGLGCILLWRVLRRLAVPGAWVAAAVFALHPVNVEAVAWIFQRKTVLAGTLSFGALLCYLRSECEAKWRWYAGALALFLAAMLSKTSAAPLPAVLLVLAWYQRGRVRGRDVRRCLPFFAVALALSLTAMRFQQSQAIADTVVRPEGFASRLAGAGWAVWFYLYKAVLPVNLAFIYPRWEIDAASPLSYAPLLLLLVMFALAWRLRRSWGRPLLAGLGCFVLMLLPVLGFVNIYYMRYSLVADHWQYPALAGVVALGVGAASYGLRRMDGVGRGPTLAAGVAIATCGVLTWRQARVYHDGESLWRHALARNPSAWIAHNNLGLALNRQGREDEAIEHFEAAIRLEPANARAHANLGAILERQGRLEASLHHYQEALRLEPERAQAHSNLGSLYVRMRRFDAARDHFAEAVRLAPDFAEARSTLGSLLRMAGQYDEAEEQLAEAIRLDPGLAEARINYGMLLFQRNRLGEAVGQLADAVRLEPDSALGHKLLGDVLARQDLVGECVEQYRSAVELKPDWPIVATRLAWILSTYEGPGIRNGAEAVALAERACRETGFRIPKALDTLAAAYAEAGRFDDAIETAGTALSLARKVGNTRLATAVEQRIAGYQAGKPYRERRPETP